MKKFFILTIVFTVSFLVACSNNENNSGNENNSNAQEQNEDVDANNKPDENNSNDELNRKESNNNANENENNQNRNEKEDKYSENSDDKNGAQGDYEVYITGEMTEEDDKISIEGESNLLPGSILIGKVYISTDTAGYLFSSDFQEYEYQADTREVVEDDEIGRASCRERVK